MSKQLALSLLLGLGISMPIWFYLVYKILILVNASELMWFLFWIYVPVSVITATLSKLAENKD